MTTGRKTTRRTSGKRPTRKRTEKPDGKASRQLTEYRRKRDFDVTPEPSDTAPDTPVERAPGARGHLRFVIQKHAATSLHFDLRLELDGVMKSWAVPKGPSLDPAAKRLAMQVEDHPIAYNTFEGIIPEDEYGGGTVMLWDRGTYFPDEAGNTDHEAALRREMKQGKLSITFEGERLRGSYALVRTDSGPKPKWLLIKHRDAVARRGYDIAADIDTSVDSGRTMDEIARGDSAVWHSDRGSGSATRRSRGSGPPAPSTDLAALAIEPMQPTQRKRLSARDGWSFEPAPDGTRVLAYVTPDAATLVDSAGHPRGGWPQITEALQALAKRARTSFVLDGAVSSDAEGATYHAWDLLLSGGDALLDAPWQERRAALDALFGRRRVPDVELVEVTGQLDEVRELAREHGWSAVRARAHDGPYTPGRKSATWLEQRLQP
ncbi:MAG TPA: DNA polymerase ligase N-terminal domain-containing protein [Longimicrobiales bacterium]|nr:DNA polymerase ligase N-terminal domain-containing protein [Longimicrobiales bacterium]